MDRKAWLCHDPRMRVVVPTVSSKRIAFLVVAGLCLLVGISLRAVQYLRQPAGEEKVTVAAPQPSTAAALVAETTQSVSTAPPVPQKAPVAPNEQAEQAGPAVEQASPVEQDKQASDAVDQAGVPGTGGDAVEQAEPLGPGGSGMILVSKGSIQMLASPSSSAPVMYGFPAGRRFRLIGRDGSFAQIQDLKSGASGWIDEAAVEPPPRAPAVSVPYKPKSVAGKQKPAAASADSKPKATKKDTQPTAETEVAAEPDPAQTGKRPGFFGLGDNSGEGGVAGFLGKVFSPLANGNGN